MIRMYRNCMFLSLALGCESTKDESDSWDSAESATASATDPDDASGDDAGDDGGESDDGADDDGADDDGADDDGADDDGADDDGSSPGDGTNLDGIEPDELVLPPGLNGTPVEPTVPLIAFSARNSDSAPRGMEDLVDGPTVIWFYPLAGSPG